MAEFHGAEIGLGKGICNQGSISGTLVHMKLLLALAISTQFFLTAPGWGASKPTKQQTAVARAKAAEVVTDDPNAPRERHPGFWERAWVSAGKGWGTTKKVGSSVGNFVTAPFHHGAKEEAPGAGWRKLSMTMAISPSTVKLPQEKSVAVSVSVTNSSDSAIQLQFPNSQRIEVLVKEEGGKVLSKWSEDQKLSDEEGFLVVNPGEKLDYTATVSTREMVPGKTYVIEAFFPTFDELRASRTVVPTK
jgi:hypothetical protein